MLIYLTCATGTMGISNSGLSDETKDKTKNKGQCQTEKLVSINPLLLIHQTLAFITLNSS